MCYYFLLGPTRERERGEEEEEEEGEGICSYTFSRDLIQFVETM